MLGVRLLLGFYCQRTAHFISLQSNGEANRLKERSREKIPCMSALVSGKQALQKCRQQMACLTWTRMAQKDCASQWI